MLYPIAAVSRQRNREKRDRYLQYGKSGGKIEDKPKGKEKRKREAEKRAKDGSPF